MSCANEELIPDRDHEDVNEIAWLHCADALVIADVETGMIVDANPQAERLFQRSKSQLCSMHQRDLHPPEDEFLARREFMEACKTHKIFSGIDIVRADGARIPVEILASGAQMLRGRRVVVGSFRSVLDRRDIEHEKERLNWAYTAIMRGNAAALRADTDIALMQATCDAMVSDNIYDLAWIGIPLDDNEKTVSCVACSGRASKYLEGIQVSWSDNPLGLGPAGAAIRTRVTQVNNDMWHNASFSPWADRARKHNLNSSIGSPLVFGGNVIGILSVYSKNLNAFGSREVLLFEELGKNLVFAIAARRDREEKERAAELVRAHSERLEATLEEMKIIQGQLTIARDLAESGSRAKSLFLAKMSHELRTPLNAVMGFSDILRNLDEGWPKNPDVKEYGTYIHQAGSHLLAIINDVLDLSKIEADKFHLDCQRVSTKHTILNATRLLEPFATKSNILMSVNIDENCSDLLADERAVRQMLFNVLSNAIKFSRAGGQVFLRATSNDLNVIIEIQDNGIGIPSEQLTRILCPFEQIDNGYARNHQGTGLGLPLTSGLVRLHNGNMTIESVFGIGTKVILRLPSAGNIL